MRYTIILFIISLSLSCTDQDVKLDEGLRKEADSLFAKKVEVISNEIDSICALKKDSMVQLRYDSIIEVRKKRIRELSQ